MVISALVVTRRQYNLKKSWRRQLFSSSSRRSLDRYYEVLGVSHKASSAQIKEKWRELARIYHPDSPSGNAKKFMAAAQAYTMLSQETSRKSYDLELQQYEEKKKLQKQPRPVPTGAKMTQETQIQGKKTSGQRSRWSVDELMRIKRETRPSTSNPPQRKPPSSPAPTQNVPSSFLKNQPLPPKEIRRREQRQALLKSNVSSVLFPDGNDPCKGFGVWKTVGKQDNFHPFREYPPEIWRPLFRRALEILNERDRALLDAYNVSPLLFPNGNDPGKGLGVWIKISGSTATDSKPFEFLPYPGVTKEDWKKARHATEIEMAELQNDLEKTNVSRHLFPDGNDPCKGYGIWNIPDPINKPKHHKFIPFNEVPYAIWRPKFEEAERLFRAQDATRQKMRLNSARLHSIGAHLGDVTGLSKLQLWLGMAAFFSTACFFHFS